jgi:hypothetical protein
VQLRPPFVNGGAAQSLTAPEPVRAPRLRELVARADAMAVGAARRPLRVLALVLVADAALAATFLGAGVLLGDRALFFRELTAGTVLSFVQLLAVAATARAAYLRAVPATPWYLSFWGLSAAVFLVFAFDEITQSAIFLADVLEGVFGLGPASGFNDLEAVLLTLMFLTAALVLLPRAGVLLRHPVALGLLAVGGLFGVASQSLDSVAAGTSWEFVAEEVLKLGAGAFLLGGYLAALQGVLTAERHRPARRP